MICVLSSLRTSGFLSEDVPCGSSASAGIATTLAYSPSLQVCNDWRLKLSGPSADLFDPGATTWRRRNASLTLQLSADKYLLTGQRYEVTWRLRNGVGETASTAPHSL